ncbi:MAG TPA: pyrroline-5-carboxylate reductase [Pyrinomonadaceae bacterium]|jgi:pyrroline-5-carboxylate reductase|nr:pyrroline-5-carboxylate reductase [Pyrinomonadaceae bacterium]
MTAIFTDSTEASATAEINPLANVELSFIGCGVMAEAILAGLLRKRLVAPAQIFASHPRANRRAELAAKYGINAVEDNRAAALHDRAAEGPDETLPERAGSIVVLAVKPQRLGGVLHELKGSLRQDQLVVSVVAGATMETLAAELLHPAVVRSMPNTPAQIGQGMTAWTATPEVTGAQLAQVRALFASLGREMHVEEERMIDMATALSATGPTYVFLVMEALVDAGVHMGFSRHVAQELVQQTILGSVLFAQESHKHPAELRNMVTSPGGTSAEAIYQMEKGSLRTVLSKAVWAAYQRAVSLGRKK